MSSITLNNHESEMVNALWTIYNGLSKKAREAFANRIVGKDGTNVEEEALTPAETASIRRGLADAQEGRLFKMNGNENLNEFLDRVEPCIR